MTIFTWLSRKVETIGRILLYEYWPFERLGIKWMNEWAYGMCEWDELHDVPGCENTVHQLFFLLPLIINKGFRNRDSIIVINVQSLILYFLNSIQFILFWIHWMFWLVIELLPQFQFYISFVLRWKKTLSFPWIRLNN